MKNRKAEVGQRIPVTLGNIAPLSLTPFRPGRMALVCEGGGQRGIFTAGVLDEFMRAQFNPFHLYFGTSAGAQNLSAYLCNQPGYGRKVIMRYTTRREFFDPLRFVRGGNLIDLDWLVESTAARMPLQMDTAARLFDSGKSFYMCACRGDDYTPGYFSPTKQNWLDIIRASSAIPGFYRTGVTLEGINYLDGGISDAIPVQEAAKRGAKTIVVIRTVPSQMYYTPQWFKRMERWLGESSLQPLVNLVQHHETSYSAIQQFIEKPPGKLRIIEIYRRNRCTAWRWAAVSRRCVRITKPGNYAGVISLPPLVNCSPQRRLSCAIRRGLPCRKRWSCLRRRWPMIRMWRRSLARRRQTTPHLPTRIWRELALYRYTLPF